MSNLIDDLLGATSLGQKESVRARLRVAVTEELLVRMEAAQISRAKLAELMGVTRSAVTQALSTRNLSLNTLADMAEALGLIPRFELKPKELAATFNVVLAMPALEMPVLEVPAPGTHYSDFWPRTIEPRQNALIIDSPLVGFNTPVHLLEAA